jgi:hypothetical protein
MQILALRSYASGYRGCLIDETFYQFFQITRKTGQIRQLKRYRRDSFDNHDHFIAMMLKFMTPVSFLRPPVAVDGLTIAELDRVQALIKKGQSG